MSINLDFGRWLERLGFKDGVQPPVLRTVQPVQIVSDASFLVSPTLAPSGLRGGQIAAPAGVRGAMEIYGGVRGGTLAEVAVAHATTNSDSVAKIATTAFTMANLVSMSDFNFRDGETCAFRLGTVAIAAGATWPTVRQTANIECPPFTFYVPPGSYALVQASTVNLTSNFRCIYQEFEAAEAG